MEKLEKILKHSYETVEYYHELFDKYNFNLESDDLYKELLKLPVLRKVDISENKFKFISNKYDINKLHEEYTSGSTGEPVCIYKSTNDKINMGRELWKIRQEVYGITPKDTSCHFHMILLDENKNSIVPPMVIGQNAVSLSLLHLNDENIKEYYKALTEHKVKWIFGMPSALYFIANYIKKNNLPPIDSIKYIELSGEYRTEVMMQEIQMFFNCDVADFYGLRETYGAAISCKAGNMHCVDNNVYVEVLDDDGNPAEDGQEGNIFITSMNNLAMPLIRYETGDRGKLYRNYKCECGKCGNILNLSSARSVEYILFKDGRRINSAVVYCALVEVNKILGDIIVQFQIIQKNYNEFHVKLNLLNNDNDLKKITDIFEENVKNFGMPEVNWTYEVVDHIDASKKTGKLKYFIREDF